MGETRPQVNKILKKLSLMKPYFYWAENFRIMDIEISAFC